MKYFINFSRIAVGSLFIISGLIKCNDSIGFSYKLNDYFAQDRKLNIVKNVGKGVVGAVVGSYAYCKWKRHTRSKKKKDKK